MLLLWRLVLSQLVTLVLAASSSSRGSLRAHPEVYAWCQEHAVDLGSSDSVETHRLILDRQTGQVWVAPKRLAAAIVRAQDLELAEP